MTDMSAAVKTGAGRLGGLIGSRTAKVGVIGLGYVGLPLGLRLAQAGFTVSGFDVCDERLDAIAAGTSYLTDVDGAEVECAVRAGKFTAFSSFACLRQLDVVIICVPTPITKNKTPDLSYIETATREVAAGLRRGQLVVLE